MAEQSLTQNAKQSEVENGQGKALTYWQDQYISFCAVGGLVTLEDGSMGTLGDDGYIVETKPMKLRTFADMAGVSRTTLWNWQRAIPNFWKLVEARRKEIGGQNRVQKVWNGVYMKAAAGNPQAAALFLANFDPNFRMPTQKVEHEAGNSWAALLDAKRKNAEDIREGEIIDASPAD